VRSLLLALLAALALPAAAQRTNNPGEVSGPMPQTSSTREELSASPVALPAWPKDADLIEFKVSSASSFRYFIDAASLSLGQDRELRYTLVARSASGVANVSYEGMRCEQYQYRIYAYGRDGRWAAQSADWREIEARPTQRWHYELGRDYFCPSRGTILSVAEGLDALRRGGHPSVQMRLGN
jgi:hypothetical protein